MIVTPSPLATSTTTTATLDPSRPVVPHQPLRGDPEDMFSKIKSSLPWLGQLMNHVGATTIATAMTGTSIVIIIIIIIRHKGSYFSMIVAIITTAITTVTIALLYLLISLLLELIYPW